jgi:hypothetical protein
MPTSTTAAELGRRGVTLMLIWEEYRQQHRDGYSYSHFLNYTSAGTEPRMRWKHAPGAACEVDYASMTLTITDQPAIDAAQINSGGDQEMLQMGFRQPDIARASQVEGSDGL